MPTEDQNKELADKVEEIIQYLDLDGKDDYIVSETGRLTRLNVPTETDILYTYSGDSKNPKGGNKIELKKGCLKKW